MIPELKYILLNTKQDENSTKLAKLVESVGKGFEDSVKECMRIFENSSNEFPRLDTCFQKPIMMK